MNYYNCSNINCKQNNPLPGSFFTGNNTQCKACVERERRPIYFQNRRALKNSLPSTLTSKEWEDILYKYGYSCAYCGVHQSKLDHTLHQDHFVPLSKGGYYTKYNIVPACRSCNSRKRDKTPKEAGMSIRNIIK